MTRFLRDKDFLAGLIFAAIGIGALLVAQDYRMGTLTRMGPGFFPMILGTVIAGLGMLLMIRAAIIGAGAEPLGPLGLRPAFFILGAIVIFGTLIDRAGLVPAIAVMTVFSWAASRDSRARELLVLIAALNLIAVGIFVYGLNMPLRLFVW